MRSKIPGHFFVAFVTALLLGLAAVPFASAQSAFNINLDAVRQSVVFLHRVDDAGLLKEAGTGFLIGVPTKSDPKRGYVILVTARHIVDPQWAGCPVEGGTLLAVLNKANFDPDKDSTGIVHERIQGSWGFSPDDSIDIAVMPLNAPALASLNLDNLPIGLSELPTPEELRRVNSGAQIASAGLLLGASGTKRNYPIFKFGYVSSVPSEKVEVACCAGCATKSMTEWMIAASLVPGNSGSPIFFVPVGFPGITDSKQRAFLLGVQSISFVGSDVAGMAPVSSLLDALRALNLPDADLTISGIPAPAAPPLPTTAKPPNAAVPGPLPVPK